MSDKDERVVQLDFQLLGTTIPPKEITKILSVTPDVELLRGERNEEIGIPRQNIWSLRSKSRSDDVGDHWRELHVVFGPRRLPIIEIAKTGRARLTVIVTGEGRIPSIMIPPSMAEFAAAVDAEIDIDHLQ